MTASASGPDINIKPHEADVFRMARDSLIQNREQLVGLMRKSPLECQIVHKDRFYYRFVFENGAELDDAVSRINAGLARIA